VHDGLPQQGVPSPELDPSADPVDDGSVPVTAASL
jgi:hypothetical protein